MIISDLSHAPPIGAHGSPAKRPAPSTDPEDTDGPSPNKQIKVEDDRSSPETMVEYEGSSEPQPHLAIFHPSFPQAEIFITSICGQFFRTLEDSSAAGRVKGHLDEICQESLEGLAIPSHRYPDLGAIAFLGATGTGKSSTINSLLGTRGVAIEQDSERGTYVVHEYKQADPGQTSAFKVKILYMAHEEIEKLVRMHAESILRELDPEDYGKEGEQTQDQSCPEFETAKSFFSSTLRSQDALKFSSPNDVEQWFRSQDAQMPDDAIISQLLGRIKVQIPPAQHHDAHSVDDLRTLLRSIYKSTDSDAALLWPLVQKIEICFDAPLLRAGVILADTPGISDTDTGIVAHTDSYIKNADSILVFAKQMRIESDPYLDMSLRRCIRLGKMYATSVVVTNIDTKKVYSGLDRGELAAKDIKLLEGSDQQIELLRQKTVSLKKRSKDLKKQAKNRKGKDADQLRQEADARLALDEEIEETETQLASAKNQRHQLSIEFRCAQIKEVLCDRLRQLSKSKTAPELPIHFVSNSQYEKHLHGSEESPTLDREATGFPGLVRAINNGPAGQFDILRGLAYQELPAAFNRVAGVLSNPDDTNDPKVKSVVKNTLRNTSMAVANHVKENSSAVDREMDAFYVSFKYQWADQATLLMEAWEASVKSSFAASCRKNGRHESKPHGAMSLSSDIMGIYRDDATHTFAALLSRIEKDKTATLDTVNVLFVQMDKDLHDKGYLSQKGTDPLSNHLKTMQEKLSKNLEELFNVFAEQIQIIRGKLIIDTDDSYVTKTMYKIFREAAAITGKTYVPPPGQRKGRPLHEARMDIMRARLLSRSDTDVGSVYGKIEDYVTRHVRRGLSKLQRDTDDLISKTWKNLEKDFDARSTLSETRKTSKQATEMVEKAVSEAFGMLNGRLSQLIQECEQYGRTT